MPASQDDTESPWSSRSRAAQTRASSVASSVTVCDEGHIELDTQDIFDDEVIDLTEDDSDATQCLLRDGEFAVENLRIRGHLFRPGDIVQVNDTHLGVYPVEFVQVKTAIRDRTGEPKLRGIPLTRTRNLMGKLPKKLNEVCMMLYISRNDRNAANEHPIFVDVSPGSVVKKRALVVTNAVYPENESTRISPRGPTIGDTERLRRRAQRKGVLVCRWRFKVYFTTQGRRIRPDEEALERMSTANVSSPVYRTPDETLRNRWRGVHVKGGSWNGGLPFHGNLIDLDAVSPAPTTSGTKGIQQKYTVFDAFSGAGGVSRGAQSAGFRVEFAVDKSPDVWQTYRLNFPDTSLYQMTIDGFIQATRNESIRADVLHLSPPCQYFSPAHTHESVHDDENIFALFGCNQLIDKIRPRVVTVEQTFGITHNRHLQYLRALIGDFTQFGYSVRWRVVRLCTWGSAQDRKRLVVIAAAPGEKLPPFPQATHSENGGDGCRAFTTIRQALGGIRREYDSLHDLRNVRRHQPRRAPYDANRLAGTITTGSGEMCYPDGTRDLTLREYACLQGFPHHHQFVGNKTSIRRQIGNAFPPNTVKVLYQHLQEWLLREDGFLPYQPPEGAVLIMDEADSNSTAGSTERSGAASSPSMMEDVMEIEDDAPVRMSRSSHPEIVDLT